MSKRVLIGVSLLVLLGILTITFFPFKGMGKPKFIKVDPAFAAYVSAYTSGIISNESKIRIRLANDYTGPITYDKPTTEKYFDFDPAIEGATYWVDNRTIEFRPAKRMPSAQHYIVDFYLSKLIPNLPKNLQTMQFDFMTMQQNFEVVAERMRTTDKKDFHLQRLEGVLSTADAAEKEAIEKLLTVSQNGKSMHIRWEHDGDNVTNRFYVDSIVRTAQAGKVLLKWEGSPLGLSTMGEKEIEVPALTDFKVTDVKAVQGNEQYVIVQFSDPIMDRQNLDGLITIEGSSSVRFTTDDNEIKAYPGVTLNGTKQVTVSTGIKNVLGKVLPHSFQTSVTFEELKPKVELVGNGVILPNTSRGLTFPFRAVGLRSVDVKVIRIFENNVLQFLQVNDLSGDRELMRVGKTVLKKNVPLTAKSQLDYQHWNNYSLDLSQLIQAEPGAIYKIYISFKRSYSTYACSGEAAADQNLTTISTEEDTDDDDVGYYSDYEYGYDDYYYYEGGYEDYYANRENPCSDAYYRDKTVSRNVLASDLGLIAKRGNDGGMMFAVSDLRTTAPVQGTVLELYDFQQQLMSTLTTDKDGFATTTMKKKPYALVAKNGTQRGYLRLDDGSSLSMSAFDVSGDEVQKGLKGFIYGERGVWRPGDTLFLRFILEDKTKQLPETHPVTFELVNPRGQVVDKIIRSVSLNGFYDFTTQTDADAPTGTWTARVKVGGATFTKDLKIETIMPNRLKLNLDFGGATMFTAGTDKKVNLDVKWLHGAIAHNLKTKVEVTLSQMTTTFKGYDGYSFDDEAKTFNTESRTVFDGSLDDKGHASFTPTVEAGDAPGMMRASFYTRVFEDGGAFSTDRTSITYSPFDAYVGIKSPVGKHYGNMLVTDTNHTFLVASVDANGKPLSRKDLTVDVYKVDWRWWWSSGEDNLAQYTSSMYRLPIKRDTISTTNGKGNFTFRLNYPDWGRYYIRVTDPESGHSSGQIVYFDWPAWAGSAMKNSEAATMLAFTTDKPAYKVGETIKLNIPSAAEGRALVTVESGSKILQTHWVMAHSPAITYDIPVTSEMAPNVYVNVTLIQPHANTKNDAPIRLYGVMPVQVDDPNTHLSPQIACADVWRPETEAVVTVSESSGKPMTYTLAVVDEGLLDLTHFKTPDPWSNFYAREALGVKTWDMYDMVMGAYGAELERILSIGGDLDASGKAGQNANRFKPMVKFIGPFHLDAKQKATHKLLLPQYVGSARVMVVAGENGAYGNAEKTVAIRKPLMILGTLPRVVGPGETVDLPVSVFAMEKKVRNVSVTITPMNLFTLSDAATKSVSFTEIGDQLVSFKLNVKSEIGVGKVHITASGNGEKANYDIEINVRNPNPQMTKVIDGIVDAGKSWTSAYTPTGMAGTNKGYVEVSSIPAINLGSRLEYLIQYPHGCVEQTTSSVFPQLFLSQIMVLDTMKKQRISQNVKLGIERLKSFQTSGGGFSYWPGELDPSEWGSNYAGHFLLEAQKQGYSVPTTMIDNWKSFQRTQALNWTTHADRSVYYNDDLDQAYRLYTLALAGSSELGAMNRLMAQKNLSVSAKWRLAAAYQLAGQNDVAKKLVAGLTTTVASYTEQSYTYGSAERDEAMILETLSLMGDRTKAASVMKNVAAQLSNSVYWMSTQTTAYCLVAISKFAGSGTSNGTLNYTCTINGAVTNVSSKLPLAQTDIKINGASAGNITVKNNGSASLYVRVILVGVPETGDQTEAENNLTMQVKFTKTDGTEIKDITKLEQGTDFIAEVTIGNPGLRGNYKELALTQIFASGWEIHNTHMDDVANPNLKSDVPTYQDIRDDRVYSYFNLEAGRSKTFRIELNASYTGKFYLPSFYCETMYDNTINAHRAGKWVEVVKAGDI